MPQFDLIDGADKLRLLTDYTVIVPFKLPIVQSKHGTITNTNGHSIVSVLAGFISDGATGAVDTISLSGAALVHDFLYWLLRMGYIAVVYRETADKIYKHLYLEIADMDKSVFARCISKSRIWIHYCFIRLFGKRFILNRRR